MMKSKSHPHVSVLTGPIRGSIITLTILTAIVHLLLALSYGMPVGMLPVLFLLNGIGYLTLLVALYLPPFAALQRLVRWVLIAYIALTIILWVYFTHAAFDPLDYVDKLIELSLIGLLLVENMVAPFSRRS